MENIHFKMETLKSAVKAMRKDCYFASVDLSDAFYSIPFRKIDRKLFRFLYNGKKISIYKFGYGINHFTKSFY
jgi:hypothetical protein